MLGKQSISLRCSPLMKPLRFSNRFYKSTPKQSLIKKEKSHKRDHIITGVLTSRFLLLLKSSFFFLNKGSQQEAVYVMAKGMDSEARFPGFESRI